MIPQPQYNDKGEVLMRFATKNVSTREYDELYSNQAGTYKTYRTEKTGRGRILSYDLIFKTPLFKEWEVEYIEENRSFKCLMCKDTGRMIVDREYCQCELGRLAQRFFGNPTKIIVRERISERLRR